MKCSFLSNFVFEKYSLVLLRHNKRDYIQYMFIVIGICNGIVILASEIALINVGASKTVNKQQTLI